MKTRLSILACLLFTQFAAKAQMKIGENPTSINSASLLELESTKKGLVFPRVSLSDVSLPDPLPAGLLAGTVVYNINASIVGGNAAGLYIWNGTVWMYLNTGSTSLTAWSLNGNSGTNVNNNFIGTTDSVTLSFRVNNVNAGTIGFLTSGSLALGANATAITTTGSNTTAIGVKAVASAGSSTAIGANSTASGFNSMALGFNAKATVDNGIAIGSNTITSNTAIAIGNNATASGASSLSIGSSSQATLDSTMSFGTAANASASKTLSIGNSSVASATNAMAIGNNAAASANVAVAIGNLAQANKANTLALGYKSTASGNSSLAIGDQATASGNNSITLGYNTTAGGNNSIAIGDNLTVFQPNSFILGDSATTKVGIGTYWPAYKLHVIANSNPLFLGGVQATSTLTTDSILTINNGVVKKAFYASSIENAWQINGNTGTNASTNFVGTTDSMALVFRVNNVNAGTIGLVTSGSVALGANTSILTATGSNTTALGVSATASKSNATAIGNASKASGLNSVALGYGAFATQTSTVAIGSSANAPAIFGIAIGQGSNASGNYAVAIGSKAQATGVNALVFGDSSKATQLNSIVVGDTSWAFGNNSIAIGNRAKAMQLNSVAFGTTTQATGISSIAIGNSSQALADNTMVLGYNSTGYGLNSIILGNNSFATGDSATVIGNNIATTASNVLILGNSSKKIGIGTTSPAYKLQVEAPADPLFLGGVQATSTFFTDSVLTILNGVVKKTPYSSILSSISATAPLTYNSSTGVLGITQAGASSNGYLSSTDWNTFNGKVGSITLNTPSLIYANPITFSVTNGAATGTLSLLPQKANTVLAGPASGVDAVPTFRTLTAADVNAWSLSGNSATTSNFIGTTNAIDFIVKTSNIERMRMLSAGNVGIGTTNPLNALSIIATNPLYLSGLQATSTYAADSLLVINAGVVKKAPTGSGAWSITGNTGTTAGTNYIGTTDAVDFVVKTAGTERMRVSGAANGTSQAGWVGIGSIIPRSRLDVQGSFTGKNVITVQNSDATGYSSVDFMNSAGTLSGTFGFGNGSVTNAAIQNRNYFYYYGNDLIMTSGQGGGGNPDFFIQGSTGNIGIGDNSPAQKLEVGGNIQFSGALMPGGSAGTAGQVLTSNGAGAPIWSSLAGNYIQNTTTQQSASNFNISGSGTIGTTLSVGTTSTFTGQITSNGGIKNTGGFNTSGGAITLGSATNNVNIPKLNGTAAVLTDASKNLISSSTATANTYLFYDGTNFTWQAGGSGSGWSLTGNSITSTNFLGSTNDQSLTFKVFNNTAGFVGSVNSGGQQTSLGYLANAGGQQGTAIGAGATSTNGAVALGYNASASVQNAIAIGAGSVSSNTAAVAIGNGASATGQNSMALGNGATASVANTISVGNTTITSIKGQVAFSTYSDGRFKTNIEENVPGLAFIMKLRPVTYHWDIHKLNSFIATGSTDYNLKKTKISYNPQEEASIKTKEGITYTGFIAQEVEKAADSVAYDFSGVVRPKNDKDVYTLSYAEFVVPLVKATQQLNQKNEDLNKKVDEQQKLIEELMKEVQNLKKKVK